MKEIKKDPTLKDFQEYVAEMVKERGFEEETLPEVFMLFLEECGEMAKAVRKDTGLKMDRNSTNHAVDSEIADVFIYLLDICNMCNVDLEEAFRKKEKINSSRKWD